VITEHPRIVTSRVAYDDSYTLSRYLATGGYDGLRKALSMTPEQVHDEVNTASLLGRGGAGFPAGRKWSMKRAAETTYLVINGDESEPATFKDHMLIERDPHQIIEGTIIAAYALGVSSAFLFCRGEFALGYERLLQACNDAYQKGALGPEIFGSGFSLDLVIDDREQCRDHGEPALDRAQRRCRLRCPRAGVICRHPALRPLRPRRATRLVRGRDVEDDVP
jgi:NADH-quinone oxidoreductase subunit F